MIESLKGQLGESDFILLFTKDGFSNQYMPAYEEAHRNLNRFVRNKSNSAEIIRVVTLICNYYLKQSLLLRLDAMWQYQKSLDLIDAQSIELEIPNSPKPLDEEAQNEIKEQQIEIERLKEENEGLQTELRILRTSLEQLRKE